jgi:chloride channel 3/4/5
MGLTMITFGCTVPGGIFLPSLIIGAITGRITGLIMQYLTLTYPGAWPFTACDYDLATRGECVIPGVYAIVGAAAGLAGVTRTTSKFQEKREGVLCIHIIFFFSFFSGDHV